MTILLTRLLVVTVVGCVYLLAWLAWLLASCIRGRPSQW
jgi:hypothetical protein